MYKYVENYNDVKTSSETDKMCWAASAANVLDWLYREQRRNNFANAEAIFNNYFNVNDNNVQNSLPGCCYEWFKSYLLIDDENFDDYCEGPQAPTFTGIDPLKATLPNYFPVEGELGAWGVIIQLKWTTPGPDFHYVTCLGYEYTEENGNISAINQIIIADSSNTDKGRIYCDLHEEVNDEYLLLDNEKGKIQAVIAFRPLPPYKMAKRSTYEPPYDPPAPPTGLRIE